MQRTSAASRGCAGGQGPARSAEYGSLGRPPTRCEQEALIDCVRRVVFQENAPMGQPMSVRLLINRTQEQGVMDG